MILRDYKAEDCASLVALLNNPNVTRYLTARIPNPYTEQDARLWIAKQSKEGINRAIEYDGTLVGAIGVRPGEYENRLSAEVGYWIGEEYWSKGIATTAVREMTAHVFADTDIIRLFAPVFVGNQRSVRVLEKCGYRLEGILEKSIIKDGCFYDEAIYAKIGS